MPFIGNTPDVNFTSFAKQTITGNGGTSYTLSHAVANENEVEIFVNNVRQEGGSGKAYTVSGTALTMTGNVANTDSFYVIFLGKALQTTVPPDGSVSTAKIANSAVDLTSKVTGVLPVANGGTGQTTPLGIVKLLDATISSPIAAYDITSTYINSSYNAYIIQAEFLPVVDGVYLYSQVFVGGTVQTGSIYGREVGGMSSSSYHNSNSANEFVLYTYATLGNAVGEGITINANLQNVNSTTRPCAITGTSTYFNTSALPNNAFFGGTILPANRANIVNGLRFYGSDDTGGNTIASGTVKLYGVV